MTRPVPGSVPVGSGVRSGPADVTGDPVPADPVRGGMGTRAGTGAQVGGRRRRGGAAADGVLRRLPAPPGPWGRRRLRPAAQRRPRRCRRTHVALQALAALPSTWPLDGRCVPRPTDLGAESVDSAAACGVGAPGGGAEYSAMDAAATETQRGWETGRSHRGGGHPAGALRQTCAGPASSCRPAADIHACAPARVCSNVCQMFQTSGCSSSSECSRFILSS